MSSSEPSTMDLNDRAPMMRLSPSKIALAMMQEWLRGLQDNVVDALITKQSWETGEELAR